MEERDVRRELLALLDSSGVRWVEESGLIRFRARRDGMVWETDCRALDGQALIYGRFPFHARDRAAVLRTCGEINARLIRGALFLPEDGQPVYRCRAELDDAFLARERLAAALEYSAEVVARFWGALSS